LLVPKLPLVDNSVVPSQVAAMDNGLKSNARDHLWVLISN
jgi:hypothetical protein